jgi:AraC family ethanolamine operon transcriptional activator
VSGLSERGLRKAFYRVRGLSPKRSLAAYRLQAVHETLRSSAVRTTTVTEAAVCHGFYELGRFAAVYKKAFGETPSATLRDSRRWPGASSAPTGEVSGVITSH